jgi:hypothetical protein
MFWDKIDNDALISYRLCIDAFSCGFVKHFQVHRKIVGDINLPIFAACVVTGFAVISCCCSYRCVYINVFILDMFYLERLISPLFVIQ